MAAPRRWREVSLADVSFATLAAQVNSRFFLPGANGVLQLLELIEAEPAPGGDSVAEHAGIERFSLIFRGDAVRPLDQNTYSFEHAHLGRFEVFIVPIGCEDRDHCYYEAVFNRPPPDSRAHGRFVARLHNR